MTAALATAREARHSCAQCQEPWLTSIFACPGACCRSFLDWHNGRWCWTTRLECAELAAKGQRALSWTLVSWTDTLLLSIMQVQWVSSRGQAEQSGFSVCRCSLRHTRQRAHDTDHSDLLHSAAMAATFTYVDSSMANVRQSDDALNGAV